MVNYIRTQIHSSRCIYCDIDLKNLNTHMDEENHYKLPAKEVWNRAE